MVRTCLTQSQLIGARSWSRLIVDHPSDHDHCRPSITLQISITLIVDNPQTTITADCWSHWSSIAIPNRVDHHPWSWSLSIFGHLLGSLSHFIAGHILNLDYPICSRSWFLTIDPDILTIDIGIPTIDLNIVLFGLGSAQFNSQSILLDDQS